MQFISFGCGFWFCCFLVGGFRFFVQEVFFVSILKRFLKITVFQYWEFCTFFEVRVLGIKLFEGDFVFQSEQEDILVIIVFIGYRFVLVITLSIFG